MLSWMEILHSLTKIAALCTGGTERKQHLCVFAGIRKRTRIMKEQSCLLWQQTIDVAQWARHGASPTITRVLHEDSGNFPGSNPTLLPRFQQHLAEQKSWQAPKDAKKSFNANHDLGYGSHTLLAKMRKREIDEKSTLGCFVKIRPRSTIIGQAYTISTEWCPAALSPAFTAGQHLTGYHGTGRYVAWVPTCSSFTGDRGMIS